MTEEAVAAPIMKIGNKEIQRVSELDTRLTLLLWGKPGCGKTAWAATAPGVKLWINFDDNGTQSIRKRTDVYVYDLSAEGHTVAAAGKSEDPFAIVDFLKQHEEVETIVLDSLSTYRDLCLISAVKSLQSGTNKISIESPSTAGYAHCNSLVLQTLRNLIRIAKKYNKNLILIAHEGAALKDKEQNIIEIPIMLAETLRTMTPVNISEVWFMRDDGKKRYIAIRPCRMRNGMKTRMFVNTGEPEFVLDYNADNDSGLKLTDLCSDWKQRGDKLPLPKTK